MKNNLNIFFSIITPVKDGAKYIDGYLNCLYSQLFKDWEVIIIDDGSLDNSFDILYCKTINDCRFRVLKNNYKKLIDTPYQARNFGLDNAMGKYICFLDIDDIWLPNKLKRQYELITNNKDINLISSDYYRYIETKNIFLKRKKIPFLRINALIKFINPISMSTSCVKYNKIRNIRFKPHYHEDYIFWKELISTISEKSILIDKNANTIYRVSNSSLSSNKIKTIFWIWKIYSIESKNYIYLFFKILIRGFFQIFIYLSDKKIHKINFNIIYK